MNNKNVIKSIETRINVLNSEVKSIKIKMSNTERSLQLNPSNPKQLDYLHSLSKSLECKQMELSILLSRKSNLRN